MRGLSGDELLKLPVRLHGIDLGKPVDVVVDADGRRAVGIELLCGDQALRFLPFAAATVTDREISVDSALAVVDDLGFYLARGHVLRELRGSRVTRGDHEEGTLSDVVVGEDGVLVELVLTGAEGRMDYGADVRVGGVSAPRSAA